MFSVSCLVNYLCTSIYLGYLIVCCLPAGHHIHIPAGVTALCQRRGKGEVSRLCENQRKTSTPQTDVVKTFTSPGKESIDLEVGVTHTVRPLTTNLVTRKGRKTKSETTKIETTKKIKTNTIILQTDIVSTEMVIICRHRGSELTNMTNTINTGDDERVNLVSGIKLDIMCDIFLCLLKDIESIQGEE